MDIWKNISLELLFFLLFGAGVLVSGATKLRERRKQKRHGGVLDGTVTRSRHVSEKDKNGRLVRNYYELQVVYSEAGHTKRADLKSTREYIVGDQIMICRNTSASEGVKQQEETEAVFTPWFLIGLGPLIAILPVVNMEYGITSGSAVLAMIFLLLGIWLLLLYAKDQNRTLIPVDAEVTDLLYWKKGKERSKITRPSVSWYPILAYDWKGERRHMRSRYNFNSDSACRIGSRRTIYYDEERGYLLERAAKKSMLFWGSICIAVAVIGLLSIV